MEIVSKIAKRILNHCSKCGGCPMAKIMDAQAETKNNTSSESTIREGKQDASLITQAYLGELKPQTKRTTI